MLDFLTGGTLKIGALVASILGVIGSLIYAWREAVKSGERKKELEHANAERANLEKIKRAQRARPAGSVSDDPNNRDNR